MRETKVQQIETAEERINLKGQTVREKISGWGSPQPNKS